MRKNFLEIVFSKSLAAATGELVRYSLKSNAKFWFISIPLFLALGALTLFLFNRLNIETNWWLISLVLYILASIPTVILLYDNDSPIETTDDAVNIGVLEPVIIFDNDFLNVNLETDRISEKQLQFIKELHSLKSPYSSELVVLNFLRKPRLFYILHSISSLKNHLKQFVNSEKYHAILITSKESHGNQVDFDILFDERSINSGVPFESFKRAFSIEVPNQNQIRAYINEVTKVYASLLGHSILDILIGYKEFGRCQRILDDCQEIFQSSVGKIDDILGHRTKERNEFIAFFFGELERYRAIIFLNQGEFRAAIRHLFKSIKINPYFPYVDYNGYKQAYIKIYIAQVNLRASGILEDVASPKPNQNETISNISQSVDLLNSIGYIDLPTFEETFREIISRAASSEINKEIENRLETEFCNPPICHIIRAEVYKFLPKGKKMINQIYTDRISKIISELNRVMQLDEDFPLIHTRIGILKILASLNELNKARKEILISEGVQSYRKGEEIFSRLGINIRSNAK